MRREGIINTVEPSVVVPNTFPIIRFKIVIFGKDLDGVFPDFPPVYESLVEGWDIVYTVRS